MNKIISTQISSPLLYLYQYIALLVISFGLFSWVKVLAVIPIVIIFALIRNAKTMKYELTDKTLFISSSFLDNESSVVDLKDVKGFYIVDRQPWRLFSLGTVLVITDVNADSHPCIKCIKNPMQLAKTIKRYALKNGADINEEFAFIII